MTPGEIEADLKPLSVSTLAAKQHLRDFPQRNDQKFEQRTSNQYYFEVGCSQKSAFFNQIVEGKACVGTNRVCPKKPAITLVNQSRRVAWCKLMKEALRKDPNLIKRLIISDESTGRQFPVQGKVMAWAPSKLAKKKLPINPQRQQGGISVMFFGSMSWHGFGPLIPPEGNQNGQSYIKTIDNAVIPYINKLRKDHGVRPVFQQDNARCHTAKIVQEHFKTQRVKLLQDELGPDGKWPASSPDLSPIENAWAHVKRLRRERYPTPKTREELINQFTAVWEGLTVQYAHNRTEADRIAYFKEGLKARTRAEVTYRKCLTLEDAIDVAHSFDDAHQGRVESRWGSNTDKRGDYRGQRRDSDDMELDYARKDKKNEQCFYCKDYGPYKHECLKKKADQKGKRRNNVMQVNQACSNGHHQHQLIRVKGLLYGQEVKILVDCGATHNFMSLKMAKRLGIGIGMDKADEEVTLGDGHATRCHGTARGVKLQVSGLVDYIDGIVLGGCSEELILGMSWLYRHNPAIDWQRATIDVKGRCLQGATMFEHNRIELAVTSGNMDLEQQEQVEVKTIEMANVSEVNQLMSNDENEVHLVLVKNSEDLIDSGVDFNAVKTDLDGQQKEQLIDLLGDYKDVFTQKVEWVAVRKRHKALDQLVG
ncbi:hypothetical protein MIR68_005038 [Amoeboaphelidium protococcarum]|nr:hypothetical protein MIR68_005038 [Amoeboaphelidium protococcarum]